MLQERCVLHPGCKINLYLRITGIYAGDADGRYAGWHELDTLFLPLPEPHDELVLTPNAALSGLRLTCSVPGVDPERNTLTRAYALYVQASGFRPGLDVRLVKGIPMGAGLGGGSSDAASLLLWLEANSPTPLGSERLADIAVRTGADVPFFLHNQPCRAQGIGQKLTSCAVPELDGWSLVLVCPDVHVATPQAFAAWDRLHSTQKNGAGADADLGGADQNGLVADKGLGRLTSPHEEATDSASRTVRQAFPAKWMHNSFEEVVFAAHPQLAVIKDDLLRHGAQGAAMSGSGSALFGVFRDARVANDAAGHFRDAGHRTFVHSLP